MSKSLYKNQKTGFKGDSNIDVDKTPEKNDKHYEHAWSITPMSTKMFLSIPYSFFDVQCLDGIPISVVKFVGSIRKIEEDLNMDTIEFLVNDGGPHEVICTCYTKTNERLAKVLKSMMIDGKEKVEKHWYLIHGWLNYRHDIKTNTLNVNKMTVVEDFNHITYHLLDVIHCHCQRNEENAKINRLEQLMIKATEKAEKEYLQSQQQENLMTTVARNAKDISIEIEKEPPYFEVQSTSIVSPESLKSQKHVRFQDEQSIPMEIENDTIDFEQLMIQAAEKVEREQQSQNDHPILMDIDNNEKLTSGVEKHTSINEQFKLTALMRNRKPSIISVVSPEKPKSSKQYTHDEFLKTYDEEASPPDNRIKNDDDYW
jgi:hypothetical protein